MICSRRWLPALQPLGSPLQPLTHLYLPFLCSHKSPAGLAGDGMYSELCQAWRWGALVFLQATPAGRNHLHLTGGQVTWAGLQLRLPWAPAPCLMQSPRLPLFQGIETQSSRSPVHAQGLMAAELQQE